jgi:hypothetical protein
LLPPGNALAQENEASSFQAWFFPFSNVIAFLTLVAVLIAQAFNPDSRFQFWFMVATAHQRTCLRHGTPSAARHESVGGRFARCRECVGLGRRAAADICAVRASDYGEGAPTLQITAPLFVTGVGCTALHSLSTTP